MRFRNLRITWSVGCGILCLLLIWLWVQSYSQRIESLIYHNEYASGATAHCECSSDNEGIGCLFTHTDTPSWFWLVDHIPEFSRAGFAVIGGQNYWRFAVPQWFPVAS